MKNSVLVSSSRALVVMICVAVSFKIGMAEADLNAADQDHIKAEQFEQWVASSLAKNSSDKRLPTEVEAALIRRLKDDRYVTDRSILDVLKAWRSIEGVKESPPEGQTKYKQTVAYAQAVRPLLYGRESLQASLFLEEATAFRLGGMEKEGLAAAEEALKKLTQTNLTNEELTVDARLFIGSSLVLMGKRKEADIHFLLASAYPWYRDRDDDQRVYRMREKYLRALRGLIDARRDDEAALQTIRILPTAEAKIRPLLDNAIREAKQKAQSEGRP